MSANYTNMIAVPGMTARVVVDADYDWRTLGSLLADAFDAEQAELLDNLAKGLRGKKFDGLMQVQFVADVIRNHPDEYDIEAARWLLSELLIRLGGERS